MAAHPADLSRTLLGVVKGPQLDRRSFLGASVGAAFLCTIGGKAVTIANPDDVRLADQAASKIAKPLLATKEGGAAGPKANATRAEIADGSRFATPEPQPGGRVREYWIAAVSTKWNYAPTGRDEWMSKSIPGRKTFTAFCYQPFSTGFASPIGVASMPGPILYGEVGDVIKVHFRNSDEHFNQAVTMHPHGVKYNPDYDGSYYGKFTRIGGFISPGEEFTYTWECTPDSVGVWPYHDHGPNHTINTLRGLFGALIIRERGAAIPDVERVLYFHSLLPQITNIPRQIQTVNGRSAAGNTPTIRAKVGQDVALHIIGGNNDFHDFHIHGHRWAKDGDGPWIDTQTVGPNETITVRWREDNPGRWLYHCHVFSHQDGGMAGWYIVDS
ncbi:MAG: multicopper oxidase domain-containing protein [Actinomycetota bacterium]